MRQINLLPQKIQQRQRLAILRNSFCLTILPTVIGMVFVHGVITGQLAMVEKVFRSPQAFQETAESRRIQQEMDSLKASATEFFVREKDLIELFVVNLPISEIAKDIGRSVSQKVWLTKLDVDMFKKTCTIDGQSYNTRLVSEFILELKKLAYFKKVQLITMGEEQKASTGEVDFKIIALFQ